MTFAALNLLFPIVLGIHNLEEYLGYDDFVRTFHQKLPPKITTQRVVRNSFIYFTLSAGFVSVLTYVCETPTLVKTSQMATFGLMLNGLGHCVLSLKQRKMAAGTGSALAIVLPYSAAAVITMRKDLKTSFFSLVTCAALGAGVAPLAIFAFLWTSYAVPLGGSQTNPDFLPFSGSVTDEI